jgi:hypothetical protein
MYSGGTDIHKKPRNLVHGANLGQVEKYLPIFLRESNTLTGFTWTRPACSKTCQLVLRVGSGWMLIAFSFFDCTGKLIVSADRSLSEFFYSHTEFILFYIEKILCSCRISSLAHMAISSPVEDVAEFV